MRRSCGAGFQSMVVAKFSREVFLPLSRQEKMPRYGLSGVVAGRPVVAVAATLVPTCAPRHCIATLDCGVYWRE